MTPLNVFITEECLKYRAFLCCASRAVGLPHCGCRGPYGFYMKEVVYHKYGQQKMILSSSFSLVAVIQKIRYSDFEIWKIYEFWGKITEIL